LLNNSAIKSAKLVKDAFGHPQIEITFTDAGRDQFAEITRQHIGDRLAIVVDGQVREAPVIRSEISEGVAEISGVFSENEAKALAAKINEAAEK
jgi:SecD/SecF fusion protein